MAGGGLRDGGEHGAAATGGLLPLLAVALFVAGLSIAPTMVTTMALVEEHVPRAKLTEGMTWTSTGLAVGVALGSSAAGWVVDAAGAARGYLVPGAAGVLAALVAFPGYRRLARPVPRRGGTMARGRGQRQPTDRHEQRGATGRAMSPPARPGAWPRRAPRSWRPRSAPPAEDGLTVKAVGTGHSFTPAAATDGLLIRPDRLTGIRTVDREAGTVTVAAGTPLKRLNEPLAAHGLSLANMGDIMEQTVSGATSTGTHGTGRDSASIAAQITALELVTADGSVLTCSRRGEPGGLRRGAAGLGALGVVTRSPSPWSRCSC